MQTINMHAAKTHLSQHIDEVAGGDEFIIARAGKPVARLLPLQAAASEHRILGRLYGHSSVPAGFDAPPDADHLGAFEGR